ncbi:MAG: hypothetical protein WA765_14295 [Candidatus Acidiferrum sp.]
MSQLDGLARICRGKDEKFSLLENLLNGLALRFLVFHDKNDSMEAWTSVRS